MIDINTQFSIIVFSYLYGVLFFSLLFICKDYLNHNNYFYRIINTITFFLTLSLIYFIGCEIVCSGIVHIYSFFIISLSGIIEYYLNLH
jgi:hypothetical protein